MASKMLIIQVFMVSDTKTASQTRETASPAVKLVLECPKHYTWFYFDFYFTFKAWFISTSKGRENIFPFSSNYQANRAACANAQLPFFPSRFLVLPSLRSNYFVLCQDRPNARKFAIHESLADENTSIRLVNGVYKSFASFLLRSSRFLRSNAATANLLRRLLVKPHNLLITRKFASWYLFAVRSHEVFIRKVFDYKVLSLAGGNVFKIKHQRHRDKSNSFKSTP